MKKESLRKSKNADDLELLGEIIKDDQWLLEKVLTKIRQIRGGQEGVLDSMAGKIDTNPKKRGS